jgi:formate-dependent nitrite reductase cytochrome c552 subunit
MRTTAAFLSIPPRTGCLDSQDRIYELRKQAERALALLHIEAKAAWDAGATEAESSRSSS